MNDLTISPEVGGLAGVSSSPFHLGVFRKENFVTVELLEQLLLAGLGVLIASQGWVVQKVHQINVAISAKDAEHDTRLQHQQETINELKQRLSEVEGLMRNKG